MTRTLGIFSVPFLSLLGSGASLAGDLSGHITAVNVNVTWNGLLVQLDSAGPFEAGCPGNWAWMPEDDPFFSATLAALLAGKASAEFMRIGTSGCEQAPLGLMPRISWVDYGERV